MAEKLKIAVKIVANRVVVRKVVHRLRGCGVSLYIAFVGMDVL